ncbi:MAG: molybdopterin-guanine dinucleotide biosynthesis protein B [Planctomycetota bacterium]|nr:molybdopterin-guanine dinucleotide biosynthesis protein B [Planctomycetota bacterium]
MTPRRTVQPPLVLGLCGFSGAGKTTLIERIVPGLRRSGLRVAVVKHDAHGLDIDKPGKDSDRLFQAGADVLVHDRRQGLLRFRAAGLSLRGALARLGGTYDLVLVEGHKRSPGAKLWLLGPGETAPPPGVSGVLGVLPRTSHRPALARRLILELLARPR